MATYRIAVDDDRNLALAVDNHLPRVWIHEPAENGPVRQGWRGRAEARCGA